MRLDASKGDRAFVWIVDEGREAKRAVWVDDESAQWGESTGNFWAPQTTHQAKQIRILQNRKLVLINPVDDSEPESTDTPRELEAA